MIAKIQDELLLMQVELPSPKREGVSNKIGSKRAELTKTMHERKTLEMIKEKQYSQWMQEVEKGESRFLDEISTIRHSRDRGGLPNE